MCLACRPHAGLHGLFSMPQLLQSLHCHPSACAETCLRKADADHALLQKCGYSVRQGGRGRAGGSSSDGQLPNDA